jgi:hypothetical protein
MAKVVVGMTVSLDGFVNDRNGSVERLYPDLAALGKTEVLQEAVASTGAVVMGRRAYEMGGNSCSSSRSRCHGSGCGSGSRGSARSRCGAIATSAAER